MSFFKTIPLLITLTFACFYSGFGQSIVQTKHQKQINIITDSILLDSLTVIESSIVVKFNNVETTNFNFNQSNNYLQWLGTKPAKIDIEYTTMFINLSAPFKNKDSLKIEWSMQDPDAIYSFNTSQKLNENFQFSTLEKSGSISRGITFGNNQDLGVNSNLSLQLNGKISNNLSILASVTDNNIPIQPDGNTQQLQDFDQAFIQIYNEKFKLTAGDIWLQKPKSYFLKYAKKAQGLLIETDLMKTSTKQEYWKVNAGMALSKGQFSRNTVQGIEGNQGPYKLIGGNNESFIIILSGTERVFIDGKLLTRGQSHDYTVDYNTAEITFTPKHLITKDRRIIVEFQYSDKSYSRSILQLSSYYKKNKWSVDFNFFNEQDNKNQPLQQILDDEQQLQIINAGDNITGLLAESADSVGFSDDLLLYAKLDSLGYEVYKISNSPDSAFFQVAFSSVGSGNGDYVLDGYSPFGRMYRWVAPDTLSGQLVRNGDFAPVTRLVAPKKTQMITLAAKYDVSKRVNFGLETALSNKDINTFSTIDNNDNLGYGLEGAFNVLPIKNDTSKWQYNGKLNVEYRTKYFNRIERYRPVEFERDWNIQGKEFAANQLIGVGKVELSRYQFGKLTYSAAYYNADTNYTGIKNALGLLVDKKGFHAQYNGSYLDSDGGEKAKFYRHKSSVWQDIKWLRIGLSDEFENNQFIDNTETLKANSYQFFDWKGYVRNSSENGNLFEMYFRNRRDKVAATNQLQNATNANHFGLKFGATKNPKHNFKSTIEYRELNIENTEITTTKPDETVLGRIEYSAKLLKGLFQSSTFYEIGSGQELKREFAYIEVQPGQGVYAWIDYDKDDVKDINEFEVSAFQDQANYVRIFTPTNEYVKTFTNQFNQSLSIRPAAIWSNKKGFRKFLTKFGTQTSLRIDRKTSDESEKTAYNPFVLEVADTALIRLNSSIRNTIFFNRSNPKFGLDYTYLNTSGKSLLSSGADTRTLTKNEVRIRWNISRKFSLLSSQELGLKTSAAEYTTGRDYTINYWTLQPTLSYQPNTFFRVSLKGEVNSKANDLELGNEQLEMYDVGTEFRYNQLAKGSLTGNFHYIKIDYQGEENSAVGFEMLEGLKNGTNFTWGLSFQKTLANNLQISLNYIGRKSEGNKAIHTGGAQVRAFF